MRSAAALFVAQSIWANLAWADAPGRSVQLELSSIEGCVSEVDLVAQVRARTPNIHFVTRDADSLVRVRFSGRAGSILGEVAVVVDGKETLPRRIVVDSCQNALESVGLILAITLDPEATKEPVTSPTPAEQGTESERDPKAGTTSAAPSGESTSSSEQGAQPNQTNENEAVRAANPGRAEDEAPNRSRWEGDATEPSGPSRWRFGATAAGQALHGPAPAWMSGFAGHLTFAIERESPWSPAFGVGGARAWSPSRSHWGGTASFALDALILDVCAWRFEARALEVRACASALLGRLSATGSDAFDVEESLTRPFAASGPLALLTWYLGSQVELSTRVTGYFNFVRDEFEFRPIVFHTVSALTLSASVGIGLRWP